MEHQNIEGDLCTEQLPQSQTSEENQAISSDNNKQGEYLDSTTLVSDLNEEGTSARCPFRKPTVEETNYHILDELEEQDDSDESYEYDSDIPDEEVERMLEEALERKKRKADEAGLDSEVPFEERTKIVVIEKGKNHFDVLPEDWLQVSHNSGMPIYLHKTTRVCTLSRPYFLGPGSARKHLIPVNAIPCLSYRKAKDHEQNQKKESTVEQNKSALTENMPNAKIETVQENIEMQNLTPEELRDYCGKLFEFQAINVLRFKSWSERRKFTKRKKQESQLQRPTLPDGTKLITFPIKAADSGEKSNPSSRREWIMNPNGKSYVCILHEYVQHALKKQPTYVFTELENAATPYAATVMIKDMKYGVGYGTSKKQAKSDAAKATLEILIPEMKSKITADTQSGCAKRDKDQDLSFFDEIRVEDPRVAEFCAKTTEPAPYDILLTCLQRNFGLDDLKINYQGNTSKHQGNEFKMTVGKYTTTVACKNKRDGKQRASQSILQMLHPSITSWGSLLRLYGNRSVKSFKEKKLEEQEITCLQSKAAVNQPNYAILNKLKMELGKLNEKRKSLNPVGLLNTLENTVEPLNV
ncbi:microprocessor complex subunit DGCR8 [Anthonomus grandis grandis]|uniref:microprocessor complex subunit DGCR8 n=1 Tax=Anthonomus grandis grandis TaxID=2921223 RepID=UPI0021651E76|nr:microprocessor complex subunit DGCR8 [Anthonomus grandis grandis]